MTTSVPAVIIGVGDDIVVEDDDCRIMERHERFDGTIALTWRVLGDPPGRRGGDTFKPDDQVLRVLSEAERHAVHSHYKSVMGNAREVEAQNDYERHYGL